MARGRIAAALGAFCVALASAVATASGAGRAPVTIAWTGDAVPAASAFSLPDDPSVLFRGVTPILSVPEITFGNLEGTLTGRAGSKCAGLTTGCFAFQAPPSYASAFAHAGFDVLNLANNHAYDFGGAGRADTVAALAAAGLRHTGGPGEIAVLRAGGMRIAFVGFSTYPWTARLEDTAGVTALVRRARAEADLVVAAFHGGAEGVVATHVPRQTETFLRENRGSLRFFAHAAVDAGADLVVGSGPHVLRGLEFYRGRLIAYSLGNFIGYGRAFMLGGPLSVSAVLTVRLAPDGTFLAGQLVPVRLDSNGIPHPDPARAAVPLVRGLSAQDFGASAARLAADGSISPPAAG